MTGTGAGVPPPSKDALSTPRAAGLAGILFGLLLGTAIVLVRVAVPEQPTSAGSWLTDSSRRATVQVALDLVPFAGIAFLWFLAAVRDRIGEREDRFFATVFIGSGLVFTAVLLGAAAAAGGMLATAGEAGGKLWDFGHSIVYSLLTEYSMRMAAVFAFCTSTIARRLHVLPRALVWLGWLVGLVLIVGAGTVAWLELAFPVWSVLLGGYLLGATQTTSGASTVSARYR
ncbi:hypothetical protein [Streptomyces sp. NPDC001480]|uniref:hypothetical protein n=1 Tax=Streptomyces sp. NPDC001480 TaxID=3364577 RepID=UPI0036C26BE7